MEKSELQKIANKKYFEKSETIAAMIATEDGQFFYPNAANHAMAHAKTLGKNKIHVLERPKGMKGAHPDDETPAKTNTTSTSDDFQRLNAKDTAAKIKAAKDAQELAKVYTELRLGDDDRATVIDAYSKKKAEFEAPEDDSEEIEAAELIKLIQAADEKEFDALSAKYDLAKHPNADVQKAYDEKVDQLIEE